jgi:hypothetical protein
LRPFARRAREEYLVRGELIASVERDEALKKIPISTSPSYRPVFKTQKTHLGVN